MGIETGDLPTSEGSPEKGLQQVILGHHIVDFCMNMCLNNKLIVEDKPGGGATYQVHVHRDDASLLLGVSLSDVVLHLWAENTGGRRARITMKPSSSGRKLYTQHVLVVKDDQLDWPA